MSTSTKPFTVGTGMICEIINPSDPYSLRCKDFSLGAVAVCLIGGGQIGLRSSDGLEQSTPILFGWEAWFKDRGINNLSQAINDHAAELADILESVLIGRPDEREELELAISALPEEQRAEWLRLRHDKKRSSMNDIGGVAEEIARKLRDKIKRRKSTDKPPR